MYAEKSSAKLAVLVFHLHPDLEAAVCCWLLKTYEQIICLLGFEGVARIKFIPSGPLRIEDFAEFGGCVDHERLYIEHGVVFIDCGYGRQELDQHRQADRLHTSSLKRVFRRAEESGEIDLMWLRGLEDVVSKNDLYATETSLTTDEDFFAKTPFVGYRDLRKLIFGLNRIYPDNPELVMQLIHMALSGVAKALPQKTLEAEEKLEAKWGEMDRARTAVEKDMIQGRMAEVGDELENRLVELRRQYDESLMTTLSSYGVEVASDGDVQTAALGAFESDAFGVDAEKIERFVVDLDAWFAQAKSDLYETLGLTVFSDKEVAARMGFSVLRYRKHYSEESDFRYVERARIMGNVVRRLFAWSQILEGVRMAYVEKPDYVQFFEQAAEAAFVAWNECFARGKDDFFEKSFDVFNVPVNSSDFPLLKNGEICSFPCKSLDFNVGVSRYPLYGKGARLANHETRRRGKALPRPHQDKPERFSANGIVQITEIDPDLGIKYLISTKGHITIRPLAFAVRLAELRKKYLCLEVDGDNRLFICAGDRDKADRLVARIKKHSRLQAYPAGKYVNIPCSSRVSTRSVAEQLERIGAGEVIILDCDGYEQLRESGNNYISVRNAQAQMVGVEVAYLTDFLSSFGRSHNTNPFAAWSPLTPQELVTVVMEALCRTADLDVGRTRRIVDYSMHNLDRILERVKL